MRLTKAEFVKVIDNFKEACDQEKTICNVMNVNSEWTPSQWIDNYYELICVLCDFSDSDYTLEYGSFLDYFIYELDFGRKKAEDCITENGKPLDLSSAEKLYEAILCRSVKNKK